MVSLSEFEVAVLEQFRKNCLTSIPWLILINIFYVFNQWNRCIYYFTYETMIDGNEVPWQYKFCYIFSGVMALLAGVMSDLYGRRIVALILSTIWISFAVAQVAALYFSESRLVYNCILTMAFSMSNALIVPVFVNFVELMPIRLRLLSMLDMCWDYSAVLFMRMVAHFIEAKKHQEIIFTFCVLFVLVCSWYIPESPFWLMNKGKISRLLAVMKDIAGKKPTGIVWPPDAVPRTGEKCKMVRAMFVYIFKTKWKRFLCCILLTAVCSGMRADAKWKIDFDKTVPFPNLSVLLNACSLPLLLICYYVFGVRLGSVTILLFLFVLNLVEMISILIYPDDRNVKNHPFQYLLADASETILHLYAIEIFPTYVRATLFAIIRVTVLAMRLLLTMLNVNGLAANYIFYFIRTAFPLVGLLPMAMPETRKSYLPNDKIVLPP